MNEQETQPTNIQPDVLQEVGTAAPIEAVQAAVIPPVVQEPVNTAPFLMTNEEVVARNRSLDQPILHYRKTDDDQYPQLPSKGLYYVLASNGLFAHKENLIGTALVKIQSFESGGWERKQTIDFLEPLDTHIVPKLPKIPGRIIAQASIFFRKIVKKMHSESGLILFFNKEKGQFMLWCPKQEVSTGSVRYTNLSEQMQADGLNPMKDGYHPVGTIHSHCDFSAFHSGTDTADEASFDGVHITLGHNDQSITVGDVRMPMFSMVSSIAINGMREQMDPEHCCQNLVRVPPAYEGQVMSFASNNFYRVDSTMEEVQQLLEDTKAIDQYWIPKVSPFVWQNSGFNSVSYPYGKKKNIRVRKRNR